MTDDEECFKYWAKDFGEDNNGAVDYDSEEEMKKLSGLYLVCFIMICTG